MILALPFILSTLQQPAPIQAAPVQDEPLTRAALTYPADAKHARIQGTVQLQIHVDAKGQVTEVNALGGPIPLRQAAIDAYSHATYRPVLVKGMPAPAIITASVNFSLNELPPDTDQLVDAQFQPLQKRCRQLSAEHSPDALAACRSALDKAGHFITPTFDLEAHATAYNDVVLLLIAPGKTSPGLPEAGVLADQAVDLINLTVHDNPHTPAVAVAYITRAEVRSLAGDLPGAAADCATAEETLLTLLHDAPENERAGNYRVQLRETLLLHAVVADRDHHSPQARALRSRAATL